MLMFSFMNAAGKMTASEQQCSYMAAECRFLYFAQIILAKPPESTNPHGI